MRSPRRVGLLIGVCLFATPAAIAQPTMLDSIATQVSSGGHTCALTSTGGVKCWGQNFAGQLGNGTTTPSATPVDVSGLSSGVARIVVGGNMACALTTAGGVKCWGENDVGQLGNGTNTNAPLAVDVSGLTSGVAAISASGGHTCAVTTGGGAKCWGRNTNGGLGDGTTTDRTTPVDVSGLTIGVASISAGGHTCAVTRVGAAKCWGFNLFGELGDGTLVSRTTPVDVSGLDAGVADIAVGSVHTCALTTSGAVKCWGNGTAGQLGDGPVYTYQQTTPVGVVGLAAGVKGLSAGADYNCAVTSPGGLKCWGRNDFGTLGDGTTLTSNSPVDVQGLTTGVASVSAASLHTCALTTTGGLKCWGENDSGRLGDGTTTDRLTPTDVSRFTGGVSAVSAGEAHTCALNPAGGVKCSGHNQSGGLGDGTTTDRLAAVDVLGLTRGVATVTTGGYHTCAVTTAGGLKCFGLNTHRQLGDGTTADFRTTAVDVPGLTSGVASAFAGATHTCVLTTAGGVKCWGGNANGQLGDGTTIDRPTPVDVVGLASGVVRVTGGRFHTCALTLGGGVKCWGRNGSGQIGDGTTADALTPAAVVGLSSGVVGVKPGADHTCAITLAGGLKCWGLNGYGELGDGTTTDRSTPVDVSGLAGGVASAAGGYFHHCAVTVLGGAKCWGYSQSGQLGDGTFSQHLTPVDVLGLNGGIANVTAGLLHTCAVTVDGGLKCWGNNGNGRLGDGTGIPRTAPVNIRLGQSIAFAPPPGLTLGVPTALSATASSGLPVTFDTWTPGTCSVTGNSVTASTAALCGIRVSQAGDGNNAPAPQQLRLLAALGAPTVITGAATAITESTATLNGTVNPNGLPTAGAFEYGATLAYGNTALVVDLGSGVASVPLTKPVIDLPCNTLIHFRATAVNSLGTITGADNTFTTSVCPPPPTVITDAPTAATQTGATLNGTINPNGGATKRRFEYGLTITYGSATPDLAIGAGISDVPVTFLLTGAECNTLYHYRAVGQSNGGLVNGADMTFTTAACPAVGEGNIHASSARAISLNSATRDFLNTVRTEVWYRVRLFANRSYLFSASTVDEDGAPGVSPISVDIFSDAAGTITATPAPAQVSGAFEGSPNDSVMLGQSAQFQPATTGMYRVRVLGAPAPTDTSLTVLARETTLFSPWTSRAAGFEGFIEMHNNTNAAVSVTLSAFNSAGVLQGASLSFSIPANATMFKTATDVGVPVNVFAGIVLTHNGAIGAISANITTLNGANGLSFDSPFTPREGAVQGLPVR